MIIIPIKWLYLGIYPIFRQTHVLKKSQFGPICRFDDLMMYNHVQPLGCFILFHLAFSSLQACLTAQHLCLCFDFIHSFSFIVLPCFPDLIYNAGQTIETFCADNLIYLINAWTYQNTQLRTLRACTQNP